MASIALAAAGGTGERWVLQWLGVDLIRRLAVGFGVGIVLG
jgi:hypothetical protein